MTDRQIPSQLTALAAAIAATLLPAAALSQQTLCGGELSCTIAGQYSDEVVVTQIDGSELPPMSVDSSADITVTINPSTSGALRIFALGANSTNSSLSGADTQGLTVTNTGDLVVQGSPTSLSGEFYGLYARMQGGNATSNGHDGGNGGVAGRSLDQIVSLTNHGNVTVNLPGSTVSNGLGAAISAISKGGAGGVATHGGGGAGGQATGASVSNTGNVNVTLEGSGRFAGVQAISQGGGGASGSEGADNAGGGSGSASVVNSGSVTMDWTWSGSSAGAPALYGILAQSNSGDGGDSSEDKDGGAGGVGYASDLHANVTLNPGGKITVNQSGTPPGAGAGVAAMLIGGNGGNATSDNDGVHGGAGGNAGAIQVGAPASSAAVQINNTDTNVATSGDKLPALMISAQGGAGAGNFNSGSYSDRNGGSGGQAGDGSVQVATSGSGVTLSTNGKNASGIQASLRGGSGGNGGYYTGDLFGFGSSNAGDGGAGGNVGELNVDLNGGQSSLLTITTTGESSPGVYALLQGGAAGAGGALDGSIGGGRGGDGGDGGSTGNMAVHLHGTQVSTQGGSAYGVIAQNWGADGNAGGSSHQTDAIGSAGGKGGSSGSVIVAQDSYSSIDTRGDDASGMLAQTQSGAGGNAGAANGEISSSGGGGGAGGASGTVTVTNAGAITTAGTSARGILALSMAGGGGSGSSGYGIFYSGAGTGGNAGQVGAVNVTHLGTITTTGDAAQGILTQSLGGAGGAGGSAGGLVVALGGDSANNPFESNANTVTVTNSSAGITTSGVSSIGVLAQSIGGGGGDGGSSNSMVSIGASGGKGGHGSTATATFDSSTITTRGDNAHGVVTQSIGGGGGNAGNASGIALFTSVSIGGTGGSGGDGGTALVTLDNNSKIVSSGSKAAGVVAQSIGGGGGTGGQATTTTVEPGIAVAVALGGTGGAAGDGSQATLQMSGSTISTGQISQLMDGTCSDPCLDGNQLPVDAFGAVVQSIGGGGGLGGNAAARALAIAVPVTPSGSQVSMSAAVSLGGAGGAGGNGGDASFEANQGASITTRGQGAHGLLVQSIGGGGGTGGDSSSLAASLGYGSSVPDGANALSLNATFSLGGSGGASGNGGTTWTVLGGTIDNSSVTPDAQGTAQSSITTYGDYANGITAQSIGGGGGNAGAGSGNTQSFGSGSEYSANITLGSTGGAGGTGGQVRADVLSTGAINTYGSSAIGVLAQSIGGGGGTSQGGSINLIGAIKSVSPALNVEVGKTGGAGGAGGEVTVNVAGSITTAGGDAAGVMAQSIGGGGGNGGSAGSDASFDNPILDSIKARGAASGMIKALLNQQLSVTVAPTLTVAVGGAGGSANTGGDVTVNLDSGGAIATGGDWSTGIFAQSVGGGGGKGGAAYATGTGSLDPQKLRFSNNVAVGGGGGSGSHGGSVTANLSGGSISTAGFGAAGILAQSVGGGGGHGANGSDGFLGAMALGLAFAGSGGAGGSGGAVNLSTTSPGNKISTTGEAGFGAVLQSVGGSGGFAGAGSSIRLAVFEDPIPAIDLTTGGDETNASNGVGGAVQFQDQGSIQIGTSGNNAFGILAQSVGGGGGIMANSQSQFVNSGGINASIYGTQQEVAGQSDGGAVTVNFGGSSTLTTKGAGAHGILAQSVGGGGGIVGLPDAGAVLTLDRTKAGTLKGGNGGGGNVSVSNAGSVQATGAGAVAILAQSVGGSGGLQVGTDGKSVYAGSAGSSTINSATVTVNVAGSASSTGDGGIGIFAQNAGGSGGVSLTVDGQVTGGGGSGTAIWTDATSTSTLTVNSSGQVLANGDNAILATTSALNVTNDGTIAGSSTLNGGTMNNQGTYSTGAQFEGDLVNNGLVALGGREGRLAGHQRSTFAPTTLTGSFTQNGSGTLQVGTDFNTGEADSLQINGPAALDGGLRASARALLPNRELHVLTVNGTQSGTLTAVDSPVFDYETRQQGQDTRIRVAGANFEAESMQLKGNQAAVAKHLQQSWDQGGSAPISTLYAALDTASRVGAGEYQSHVSDLSPGVALAPAAQAQFSMARLTSAMMSCPTFKGGDSLTGEQNCFWGEVTGRRTDQDGNDHTAGFSYDSVTYQIGGQRQVAPNWFLGGSVAYQNTRLRGDDSRIRGNGDSAYAGIVLKREADAWTFSGALGGGYGSYDLDRHMSITGVGGVAESSPDVYSLGARLRAAHTYTQGNVYVKPYVDLDATYTRMPSYTESGAARLRVDSSDQFVVGITPALEVGGRIDLDNGMVARPYAYVGISLLSADNWKTKASLLDAPAGAGSFTTSMPTDNVIGRVGLGVQLMKVGGADLRLQYDGEFASKGTSHAGAFKLAIPF